MMDSMVRTPGNAAAAVMERGGCNMPSIIIKVVLFLLLIAGCADAAPIGNDVEYMRHAYYCASLDVQIDEYRDQVTEIRKRLHNEATLEARANLKEHGDAIVTYHNLAVYQYNTECSDE